MTAEGHKKELQFEQDAVRELECKEKQANARRAQLEREVASLKQKACQDVSGQGELWNTLRNKDKEHEAALKEKEVCPFEPLCSGSLRWRGSASADLSKPVSVTHARHMSVLIPTDAF